MEAFYQHSKDVRSYNATYTVPHPPASVANNILYYWIGLQDLNSAENPAIQPVLSFVPEASSNNWYFESWNCCPAGHKLKATSVDISGPGAVLCGGLNRDSSDLFSITSSNSTGATSTLLSDDTNSGIVRKWNWVEIVLETYSIDSCSQYSAGGVAGFHDMTVIDVEGGLVAPNFTMNPYINGKYLPSAEAKESTACCGGEFKIEWPSASMQQN